MQRARWLLGLATGVLLGAALFGHASSLRATSGSLGGAAQVVSSCQGLPIRVSYELDGSDVTGVTLRDIDASSCRDATMLVSVTAADSRMLAEVTTTVPATSFMTIPISPTKAADVFGVHVAISG
jgi:hypothetical protein